MTDPKMKSPLIDEYLCPQGVTIIRMMQSREGDKESFDTERIFTCRLTLYSSSDILIHMKIYSSVI
jgi:hypothetical protein